MRQSSISLNTSDAATIESHLRECDERFHFSLSTRVNIGDYSRKLASLADRLEAWHEGRLVGLVAVYLNNLATRNGFLSSVSVSDDFEGKGLASELIRRSIQLALDKGCEMLELEVSENDQHTKVFYLKHGFEWSGECRSGFIRMRLSLLNQ